MLSAVAHRPPYWFLAFLLTALSCGGDCEPAYLDNGFIVVERTDGSEVELHPGVLPAAIAADETVEDATLLPEVIDTWNEWLSQDGVERVVFAEASAGEEPRVRVAVGYVPSGDDTDLSGGGDPLGVAHLDYDPESGEIVYAEVTLSSDIAYDRPTLLKVLEHESGHFLGLADDPGIDVTVDLRSVMSDPLDPLGRLTGRDFNLVLPYLP